MSKTTTKYTLEVAGELTDFTKSTKATVVAEAQRIHKATKAGVRVLTQTGHESFALKETKTRVITFHTKPYTKTIVLPEGIAELVPAGYASAYARLRNGATVLRRESDLADDDSRYAVMNTETGAIAGYAPTTRAAGQIMKGMRKPAAAVA